jgi:hypothetical protein
MFIIKMVVIKMVIIKMVIIKIKCTVNIILFQYL